MVAKPAKKAPAKKTAPQKNTTTASKAPAPPAKKAAPKKAVPQLKKPAKAAPVAKKVAPPPAKKAPTPPVAKKAAPVKTAPVKKVPEKEVHPVKKPSVAAPSQQEVKPEIKPLEKNTPKKEAPKKEAAAKPVVIPKTSTTKKVKYEPEFMKSVLDVHVNENSGPTQRYSDAELVEFRDLINRKLETAKKELAYLQGLITRKDESGDIEDGRYMTMEDGSMSMEREQLSQMASRQITFIDHLEKAIMRIENKTYGICRVTGKLIDKARLRAVPHANLSIEAKQMMNK
jgi:RNA polymerase-binding transcription factor DksA